MGAGRWGQLDLTGDLTEFTLDWNMNYANPCHDCADVSPNNYPVIRGGGWSSAATDLVPTLRSIDPSGARFSEGFRCARAP
jgi:formylglycine-generating enzyme required for sulfatase activity